MAEGFALASVFAKLESEAETTAQEGPLPSSLPIEAIETWPTLFQVREMSPVHVEDIARALREGGDVPPLLVLRTGHRAILLDGHHRLAAHRKAGFKEAAVKSFVGSVREAVLAACAANSITKLPMTTAERQDAAWRYVLLGIHSKAAIARASGASTRTVATMRSVAKRLGGEAHTAQTWANAMRMDRAAGREDQTEEERLEWIEAAAQSYADTMARTFQGKLTKNPEIAARALAIHFGRRLENVVAHLGEWLPDRQQDDY